MMKTERNANTPISSCESQFSEEKSSESNVCRLLVVFFGFGGGVGGLSFLGVAPCDRDVCGHRKSMGEKFTSEKGTPKKKYAKKLLKN